MRVRWFPIASVGDVGGYDCHSGLKGEFCFQCLRLY